jgi:curved DNA-binding protein CbpA
MNYNEACVILELSSNFNYQELKHNYYSLALKYHPDKNFEIDATSKFQNIQCAYNYLNNLYTQNKHEETGRTPWMPDDNQDGTDNPDSTDSTDYNDFVKIILDNIINKKIYNEKIISLLTLKCNELTFTFLNSLPKHTIIELHAIVAKYSSILNINPDILDKINKINLNLNKNNETNVNNEEIKIILKPSLTNLLNADLYKYTDRGNDLYVPYWHHELVYDLSQCTIIFKCEPDLPDFITIDEFNNLYITITINICDIINFKNIDISIGDKMHIIPVNELKIIKQQTYTIKKQGIPLINMKKIYNITLRADIHFNIVFKDML